jgi:hypothetical protein
METNFSKTDEELKQMSDNELFEYLDAKAEYLKNHKKPLSPYLTKRFAYIGAAVQNSDKGTDDVYKDTNYDSIKKIAEENGKMGMDILIKKIKNK